MVRGLWPTCGSPPIQRRRINEMATLAEVYKRRIDRLEARVRELEAALQQIIEIPEADDPAVEIYSAKGIAQVALAAHPAPKETP